jgi:transcriptional regulator with XRE-family HTH domain
VQNFPDRLKSAIKSSGKRKGALAVYCGVEPSTVTRWLNGTQPMTESVLRMAEFLGVDAKWLLTGENAESSTDPKESGIGDSAYVMREEPAIYRVKVKSAASGDGHRPPLQQGTLDERVERLERLVASMADLFKNLLKP